MPVPPRESLVLVTGGSGYIASWISLYLLEQGYAVRGTTRTVKKGEWMRQMYAGRGFDRYEYCLVSDLENVSYRLLHSRDDQLNNIDQDDAFDEAVKGAESVIHTASPFHWNVEKPDDFIIPAVAGTVSLMNAAAKESGIKRVVITSSYASILENKEPGTVTFTEDDWNQQSINAVNQEGVNAWRMHWYRASKTLAERAAWDFMEKENRGFDLVTICPPYVLGPIIHQADRPDDLNTSVANWYSFLSGAKSSEDAIAPAGILCDVRDVAQCHVKALLLPEAAGQRFGVATRAFNIQVLIDHVLEPENAVLVKAFPALTRGIAGHPAPAQNWFDCSRSLETLQIEPHDARETAHDPEFDGEELGIIGKEISRAVILGRQEYT